MKPLLRLIKGGKPLKMKFASFGRDQDIGLIEKHVADPLAKARRIKQTLAAHDLNEGVGTVAAFIEASREAIYPSTQRERDEPLALMARIAAYHPECLEIWNELAESSSWNDRFTVACRLYGDVPDAVSDRLFNVLRRDNSNRVREIAVSQYEWRPNPKYVEKIYDAGDFDERVRRGEVTV